MDKDDLKKKLETLTPKTKPAFLNAVAGSADPFLQLKCPGRDDPKKLYTLTTSRAAVSYLQDIDENRSLLVLHSGEAIALALSYDEAHRRIYLNPEGLAVIDLREYASVTGGEKNLVLADQFSAHSAKGLPDPNFVTTFSLFSCETRTKPIERKLINVTSSQIERIAANVEDKKSTWMKLNNKADGLYIDYPFEKFAELLNRAKIDKIPLVDLTEETRYRAPEVLPDPDKPVTISMFASIDNSANYKLICFSEKKITNVSADGSDAIKIWAVNYIDGYATYKSKISLSRFQEILAKAKREGRTELDLTEETRVKPPGVKPPSIS